MDEFAIAFHRDTPLDYDRLVTDLHRAILVIARLGIETLADDIRAGGGLSLGILEAQAVGAAPELPGPFLRVLGALRHLVRALGDLSDTQPVPDLAGWNPRTVADYLLEAERAATPAAEASP